MPSQSHRFSARQSWTLTKPTTALHIYSCWQHYFSNTCSYTAMRFIFEMTLLAWFLKIVVTLPISLTVLFVYGDPGVWQNPQQVAFAARPITNILLALAVAPLLETMMGQWAPIALIQQWTPRQSLAVAAATLFFAGLHILAWNMMIVVATLPVGLVLAWSFLVWQRQSLVHAMGVTVAIHALHNMIALVLMVW